MRNYCAILLLFVLFIISCKKENTQGKMPGTRTEWEMPPVRIDIEIAKPEKGFPFDSLVDKVNYIKLETTDNNLIGRIDQVLFAKDRIVVLDRLISKAITVYDMQGRFLNKIGNLGQGPGEYSELSYITLTPDSSQVAVQDFQTQRFYTLDGTFVKSTKLPFNIDRFDFITDSIVAIYSPGGNLVESEFSNDDFVVIHMNGEIIYSRYPCYYKTDFTYATNMPIRKFDNQVFFNHPYNDTIFQVHAEGLQPRYVVNFVGYPSIKIDKDITNKILESQLDGRPHFTDGIIELKDAAVFEIFGGDINGWSRSPFFIYSKTKKKLFMCNGAVLKEFLCIFWKAPIARYGDNTVVSVTSPSEILDIAGAYQNYEDQKLIKDLSKGLTEDSNPVLFFYNVSI